MLKSAMLREEGQSLSSRDEQQNLRTDSAPGTSRSLSPIPLTLPWRWLSSKTDSIASVTLAFMHESVLADLPKIEAAPVSMNRTLAAIAVMSCASLLLELALTRLFSVVLFYHFAFLAISV